MERINQHSFFVFGRTLQKLIRTGEVRPELVLWDLYTAQQVLVDLLNGKPIPLGITRDAAEQLHSTIDNILNDFFKGKPNEKGKREWVFPTTESPLIPEWRWSGIVSSLDKFETIFAAEMAEATTYYIRPKGIYLTPALIDRADDSFPEELLEFIPDKTRADWRAAGRCLAFNVYTASGFHVVRAVEGMLEKYYQVLTGNPDKTLNGWHDYLTELKKPPVDGKPAAEEKTIAAIQRMKDDYRNPVAHPRVVLTDPDARLLFDMGESVIIGMAQGLKEIS